MTDLLTADADLVRRLAELQAQIAELTELAEGIKTELRTLPAGDHTIDGKPALRIVPTRRFDPKLGITLVPEVLREQCYTTDLDAAKVREFLSPALLDTCMVDAGKPKVSVL